MSQANQALWFDAVPLLVVSAAYVAGAALLASSLAVRLVFAGVAVATGLLLVLTADCKARNAPRFASPSAREASESASAFQ